MSVGQQRRRPVLSNARASGERCDISIELLINKMLTLVRYWAVKASCRQKTKQSRDESVGLSY